MLAGVALVATPALAQQVSPERAPPPALAGELPAGAGLASEAPADAGLAGEVPADAGGVMIDELALSEADLRMTVPVSIAGGAPWPFVIDTGAERTVVSAELARRLALPPGPPRRVTTMAGTAPTATALIPDLRVGSLAIGRIEAPVFTRGNLGAIGMLGIDALQEHKVAIDFVRNTMTLAAARSRRRQPVRSDEIVIVAKSVYGQLIVTDARWRGRKIAVVIDTGSALTVGNLALLRVGRRPPPLISPVTLVAASGASLAANTHLLDRLEIGGATFIGVPVAVADAAPFKRFGLTERPALLLGMDALRLFRAVEIDFANRTIVLKLPRTS